MCFQDEYSVIEEVGKGQYGVAYKVKSKVDNKIYVAKSVPLDKFTEAEKKKAYNQLTIMKEIKHPHIVDYIKSFLRTNEIIMILEFCEYGDLAYHIRTRKESGQHFSQTLIVNWLLQMLMAVDYIHKKKIVHRDIKSANIFLTANALIKVGDFGISKILSQTTHSQTFVGTPYYMSPEICTNQSYTTKADLWSLGCVMFEVCAFQHPFKGKNLMKLLENITTGEASDVSSTYSLGLRNIIKKLLTKDPIKRPNASELLFDPWMIEVMKKAVTESSHLKKEFQIKLPTAAKKPAINPNILALQEKLIMERMRQLEIQTEQRLQALQNKLEDTQSLALYEQQIKRRIKQLEKAVSKGFKKIRNEPMQDSIKKADDTIVSVLSATDKTTKSMQSKSMDKTIESQLMKTNKQLEDMTIRSFEVTTLSNKEPFNTIKSNGSQFQELKVFSKFKTNDLGLETIRSKIYEGTTMNLSKIGNAEQEILKMDEELVELHADIENDPNVLLDETLFNFTISNAGTFKNSLKKTIEFDFTKNLHDTHRSKLSKSGDTSKMLDSKETKFEDIKMLASEEIQEEQYDDDFEDFEEDKKNYKTVVDREKQKLEILEIYRSQLLAFQKNKHKNPNLVLSQIKQVSNENSYVTNEPSSMSTIESATSFKK